MDPILCNVYYMYDVEVCLNNSIITELFFKCYILVISV